MISKICEICDNKFEYEKISRGRFRKYCDTCRPKKVYYISISSNRNYSSKSRIDTCAKCKNKFEYVAKTNYRKYCEKCKNTQTLYLCKCGKYKTKNSKNCATCNKNVVSEFAQRNETIIDLKKNRMPMQKIGEMFNISKERVRQICGIINHVNICAFCHNEFTTSKSNGSFCSKLCSYNSYKLRCKSYKNNYCDFCKCGKSKRKKSKLCIKCKRKVSDEKILELYNNGFSISEIARSTKVSNPTILRRARILKLNTSRYNNNIKKRHLYDVTTQNSGDSQEDHSLCQVQDQDYCI